MNPRPENLQVKKAPAQKKMGVIDESKKKDLISKDLADPQKMLDKIAGMGGLHQDKDVKVNLTADQILYLGAVKDMDLYKQGIFNFENLPALRLAKEQAILTAGPQKLSGCRKSAARARWYIHQKRRVAKAKQDLEKHQELLDQFEAYQKDREQDIAQDTNSVLRNLINKELVEKGFDVFGENKPTDEQWLEAEENVKSVSDYLENVNANLTSSAISEIDIHHNDFAEQMDKVISYEIKEGEKEKEKKAKAKQTEKKKKNLKKKGTQADLDDFERQQEIEEELFEEKAEGRANDANVMKTEIKDLDGGYKVELGEIASLFKKVLFDNSLNEVKMFNKLTDQQRDSLHEKMSGYAEQLKDYSDKLNIPMPEELSGILELKNNGFLMGRAMKMDPKSHSKETYVLLMSSVSKIYYECLNRYAGYDVTDGLNKYSHEKNEDGDLLKNFDILNRKHFMQVRNIRDTAAAYADQIRKNRLSIFDMTTSDKEKAKLDEKINVEIIKDAQPVNVEDDGVELEIDDQEEIYKEWEELIRSDIRGVEAVADKDAKQKPWVLKDYADDVLRIMKANPEIQRVRGEEIKRYLISINDNLYHNLLQLSDELPKTSVGAKFCYVPKMRDDFIEKVKKERFAMLLRPDEHIRELLKDNKYLDELFDAPTYVAIQNRQRAIMDAINKEIGVTLFNDTRSLASLWADKTITSILLAKPQDKDEQIEKSRGEIIKELKEADKDEKAEAEAKKEGKEKPKSGNVLNYVIEKLLSKNKNYGISDENFKNTIEKIKATVHENLYTIDKKMSLLGLCDTAKELLKASVVKSMGGEYLLGYNKVSEDIVEYNVKNMMAFDGTAAEVQKTWDRKFARTGLPGRLSAKIERAVSKQVNPNGKNKEYYLKPKGFKAGKEYASEWNSVNKKTNKIIDSLKKLYNNDIKDLLQKISESEETRSKVKNAEKQYVGGKLRLTKKQWDLIDDHFENIWLESFKSAYENGEYSNKIVKNKLPEVKDKVIAAIDKQLENNFNIREKLKKGDKEELQRFEETLLSRDEYQEEKSNVVALSDNKTTVITADIEEHIFRDDLLRKAFKHQEERDLFNKVLNAQLRDVKSALHAKYSYLDDIRSIEQLSELSIIDYAQFFMDMKQNLSVVGSIKDLNAKDALLIDDWKMCGTAGDSYGIKEKLLGEFMVGEITPQIYKDHFEQYDKEAKAQLDFDHLRIDALLSTDFDPNDSYLKFNYLDCVGKNLNQVKRIKKINYAEQFWKIVQSWDENLKAPDKYYELEKGFSLIIQKFLNNIDKVPLKAKTTLGFKRSRTKEEETKLKILEFGKFLNDMKISEVTDKTTVRYELDVASQKTVKDFFGGTALTSSDLETLRSIKIAFEDVVKMDQSEKKVTISDCIGEILLFGCGKNYYGTGSPGEKVFTDSDDDKYYFDIASRSSEFLTKMQNLQATIDSLKADPVERHRIMTKLKPVVAGIDDSFDKEVQAENVKKFGIENISELMLKLQGMYGTDKASKDNLAKSKSMGELYLKRRNYIDNYGDLKNRTNGKFRLVRDLLLKEPDFWNKIFTATDAEFEALMKEKDAIYGRGLDMLMSDYFRGSMPINEQYVMANWKSFKDRTDWTDQDWYDNIAAFHHGFETTKINGKSIFDRLNSVQDRMVKEHIDPSKKQGTILMKMSYILGANPSSFALLYDEEEMFAAIKQVDKQYKENMNYFDEVMNKIAYCASKKEPYVEDKELDAFYKEVANMYITGDMINKNSDTLGLSATVKKEYKKQDTTEHDETYANYSLLMQILNPEAYHQNTGNFKTSLLQNLLKYKEALGYARNSNIYSDRTVLDVKEKVRVGIQIRKSEGRTLQAKQNEKFNAYREKRQTLGSIGLVAYNADPKFDRKTIKKATEFVNDNLNEDYGQADAEFIKGLLAERAIAFGKMKDEDLADHLKLEKERLLTLDKELRKDSKITEDDIQKAIVFAFAQNANRMGHLLDGSHDGDVKEILDELQDRAKAINIKRPVSGIGQREYDEFMEEMDMARFTMSKADYTEICDNKRKYFELVDACAAEMEKASKELKVQLGLFEYLKKDIYQAIESGTDTAKFTATVADEISKVIGDKVEKIDKLEAKDIQKIALNYIDDSSKLMQQISKNQVSAEEKLKSTTGYTRADLEKEISLSGSKKMIEQYNKLTLEEQKVFAMALTFPDVAMTDSEQLTSNVAIKDREKDYKKELDIQEQLSAFIYNEDFSPKIDYNLVMRRLMKTDKSSGLMRISKTMFDKAMKYTNLCIVQKVNMMPKDFEKLSDARLSAELGRELTAKMGEYQIVQDAMDGGSYYGAKSFKEFFKRFSDDEVKRDKSVKSIVEKFGKYTDAQMYMLLHVLQDRTAVDYTTNDGVLNAAGLGGVGFVNEERREALRNEFLRPDGMDNQLISDLYRSVGNEMYEKAVATLFSYQLRDDIDLSNKSITKSAFKKGALDRKTKIDWSLLDRAMELVDELEHQNLKIRICRQTVEHTTDKDAPNVKARKLGDEINDKFKVEFLNHFDFFNDFLVREAKKDPNIAVPMISAFNGMSMNEKMLVVHALKHRDILDVSKENKVTNALGLSEDRYVNEIGRDQLADYYIDHFGVPGATNVMATNQYDTYDALRSLVSTQIADNVNADKKKTFADNMEGVKLFNWKYIGGRSTGVDWELFGNAIKFVKRTESERKFMLGSAEAYRSAGDIDKYGRFMYNYQYMRKNLSRSGFRLTRFIGRRLKVELENQIPGWGVGKRVLMACLSPHARNKLLNSGVIKPGTSKNMVTDILGYSEVTGTAVRAASAAMVIFSEAAKAGSAIVGEGVQQASSALSGLFNVGSDIKNIVALNKPMENEDELKKKDDEKRREASKRQTKEQMLLVNEHTINTEWLLKEVSTAAASSANMNDILDTVTNFTNVFSTSSIGVTALTNVFVGGIQAAISETLNTARFIMRVCTDKKMMNKYFDEKGPVGAEIAKLRGENVDKLIADQSHRIESGSRDILEQSALRKSETEFMGNMSNEELFRKAYGFKDFSEQASYVGWNIVQTLIQSTSPFNTNLEQFMRASMLLSAIGCKDAIGKMDNDTAQRVYNRLMGTDIR